MKKKHPSLRRNIKFSDVDKELVMDIKLDAEKPWKEVHHEIARSILTKTRRRTESVSRRELESLVKLNDSGNKSKNSDEPMSDDSSEEDTVIDLTDTDNKNDKSSRSLSFINANARYLGPKIESISD